MHVKSKQIIVAKSGKVFWKLLLKKRGIKQNRTYMSFGYQERRRRRRAKRRKKKMILERQKRVNLSATKAMYQQKRKGM